MKKIAPKNARKKKKSHMSDQQFGSQMATMYAENLKKKADDALAEQLREEALEYQKYLRALFHQIDVSDDGKISFEEFSMFLQSQGLNTNPHAVRKLICQVDTDAGDDISFEEFASFFENVVDIEGIAERIRSFDGEARHYLTLRQRVDFGVTTISAIVLFLCITLLAQEMTYAVEEAAEDLKRNNASNGRERDAEETPKYRPAVSILSFLIGLSGFYLLVKAIDHWCIPICKSKIIKVAFEAEQRQNATARYMLGAQNLQQRTKARAMEGLSASNTSMIFSEQIKWRERGEGAMDHSIADILKSQKQLQALQKDLKQRKTMGIAFDLRQHQASQVKIGVTTTTAAVEEKSKGEIGQKSLATPLSFRERRLVEKTRKGVKPGKLQSQINLWSPSQSSCEELANKVTFAPQFPPEEEREKKPKHSLDDLTRALRNSAVSEMLKRGEIWGTLAKVVGSGYLQKKTGDEESNEMRALRKDIRLGDGVKFPEHLTLTKEAAGCKRKAAMEMREQEEMRKALEEGQRAEEEARKTEEEWIRTYCGNLREIKLDRTPMIERPTRSSPYHPNSFHEANKAQHAKYAFNPMNPSKAYLIGCPMKIPNDDIYDISDQSESAEELD